MAEAVVVTPDGESRRALTDEEEEELRSVQAESSPDLEALQESRERLQGLAVKVREGVATDSERAEALDLLVCLVAGVS